MSGWRVGAGLAVAAVAVVVLRQTGSAATPATPVTAAAVTAHPNARSTTSPTTRPPSSTTGTGSPAPPSGGPVVNTHPSRVVAGPPIPRGPVRPVTPEAAAAAWAGAVWSWDARTPAAGWASSGAAYADPGFTAALNRRGPAAVWPWWSQAHQDGWTQVGAATSAVVDLDAPRTPGDAWVILTGPVAVTDRAGVVQQRLTRTETVHVHRGAGAGWRVVGELR